MNTRSACILLLSAGLSVVVRGEIRYHDVPPLPAVDPTEAAPFPAWLPESVRGSASAGSTSILGMAAAWLIPPLPGRPGLLEVAYSNRTQQAFRAKNTSSPFDGSGILCFALESNGGRRPLEGFPEYGIFKSDGFHFVTGQVRRAQFRLPEGMLAAAAGSQGLILAYADRQQLDEVVYWAECAPLTVPAPSPQPGVAGTNEWLYLLAHWRQIGMPEVVGSPERVVRDFPELAPFYPGVILDASLPEAFRLAFAARTPSVTGYNPAVYDFIVNAPDKDAPLVIAALKVLSRTSGATPEERTALKTAAEAIYAMSQDPQYPLLFRMHAAKLFRVGSRYNDFMARTEPMFKLLVADELRGVGGIDFPDVDRLDFRSGLTAVLADNSPFEAGPMAGKYPENATVGQVAAIILADMEAMWAAEPYQPR